ncbi:cyclic di-GMP phosphodiesterase [Pantoea allii]|uniref:Cyclic di-GMP phosphodiesterase n=1 Tax=Pantoea allii TaxID=574096 RepID=A0ABS6VDR1_9GAMM|nr:cyclic di-GMP phosphodiesterase [Pantoea allii]MBW1214177.1 cyclic di-GMP phosphodiesterase [Pantoea allii]MBW1257459.1 cyclic di-GMP phosphodiesterase [Pantoea allii]MBW1268609.1 cyclic di-GMP phosphodiesterase [Pantoea allii]MBW1290624.1 cyclic di-GMP phosphodiesterase [Pantoea allii]MDJ0091621.1 cyclic di-GMP phosphodiesterase [Pantoea allii]
MPLSRALIRQATYPRRIAWNSAIVGSLFFLLLTSVLLTETQHQRENQHKQLLIDSSNDFQRHVATLITDTLSPLLPFVQSECYIGNHELTARAAFAGDIRAIILVKDGNAFCSSATGSFFQPLSAISARTDTTRDRDIRLLPGTPMQPTKPVLAIWIKQPGTLQSGIFTTLNLSLADYQIKASSHPEITGIAILAHNTAMTSWQTTLVRNHQLPPPLTQITMDGLPFQFALYGSTLSAGDFQTIMLSSLLMSLLAGCTCWFLLTRVQRPGKEITLGIRRGEFRVEYQPLITAQDGKSYGMEALLRWTHPSGETVSPDIFISYAEAQNQIIPLTRHLFELVARDAHQLRHSLPKGTCLSLNISPLHLSACSFRDDVLYWQDNMPHDHFQYVFEITERAVVENGNATELFHWLHQRGIKIAVDDFGTGHSALIYLEKYPFDYLKIDRGFVQSIGTETITSPVLDTVLQLAKRLNLMSVAEGVETDEQASWLINRGVTHLQGYFFSRPLRPEQVKDYFQRQNSQPTR